MGGSSGDLATSIQQTSDSGYIVAGYSYSTNGDVTGHHGTNSYCDYWIVQLNSTGDIIWQKSIGGSAEDRAAAIQQTSDGGYIVSGNSESTDGDVNGNHGSPDYWIVKLNSSGDIIWQKSLGGSSGDLATSIQQTADDGYIVAGYCESVDGDVTGNHGDYDYWVVKLSAAANIEETESSHFVIYPNPVSNELIIETTNNPEYVSLDILNAVGQKIYGGFVTDKTIVSTTDFAPGVYVIKLGNGKEVEFRKVVKE
ncbi:hypothetical protein SDC9_61757 [bioreactor metagenome]|uniref:Secretion system C-terminal sorting domain-containing protein n=1 Tax=bioreactor metagenome TaxID=1076179 RepID=A0A644XHG3_9ZZZZ